MTNNHSALIALALAASTFAMGCGSPTSDGEVGAGHARLIMSNGGQPADLVVTARDDVSGSVSFQETVHLDANLTTVLVTDLPASTYTIAFEVLGEGGTNAVIGAATAHTKLDAGVTTEIKVNTAVNADGNGATVNVDVKANVSTSDDMSNETCLQGKVECLSSCDAALAASLDPLATVAHAACVSACNVELATCEAG